MLDFVHIPKNGGCSFKYLIKNHKEVSSKIKYHHHSYESEKKPELRQIIILRDPISRFASALRYSKQKWPGAPQNKKLFQAGIEDINSLASILDDPFSELHQTGLDYIYNLDKRHTIGRKATALKWTYTPQYRWFKKPAYILILDTLNEDVTELFKDLDIPSDINFPNKNTTNKKNSVEATESTINFLKKQYAKDFDLYYNYKDLPFKERRFI